MALKSPKDLRMEDAAAAAPCLNPCLRCLAHYKSSFGAKNAIVCKFGADASLQDDLVDQNGAQYRMCGNCLKSGQHCLEIGGEKFRDEMAALSRAIKEWNDADEDQRVEKSGVVRKLAQRLHPRASQGKAKARGADSGSEELVGRLGALESRVKALERRVKDLERRVRDLESSEDDLE